MAINKFSSLLLISLMMMFVLLCTPIYSGEINDLRHIKNCGRKCISTENCNERCIHAGYEEGKCLDNEVGGVECCCLAKLKFQVGSSIPN
ncbi:PREDICTED: putative defensin-like protein 86 [Camelina sativa]|uniref:Defensin-like protein 86 n=1 Tax=Camelina sativa TaxID=90675 RepID=A0ABM1R0U9_CAMSA|nr:PREDICTED: putative defensin-like protein 86 [Camelina sativa]